MDPVAERLRRGPVRLAGMRREHERTLDFREPEAAAAEHPDRRDGHAVGRAIAQSCLRVRERSSSSCERVRRYRCGATSGRRQGLNGGEPIRVRTLLRLATGHTVHLITSRRESRDRPSLLSACSAPVSGPGQRPRERQARSGTPRFRMFEGAGDHAPCRCARP